MFRSAAKGWKGGEYLVGHLDEVAASAHDFHLSRFHFPEVHELVYEIEQVSCVTFHIVELLDYLGIVAELQRTLYGAYDKG